MLGIFLDLETSGLDPRKHRVLEIAIEVVDLASDSVKASYETMVFQDENVWGERDLKSIEINGITYESCIKGKTEEQISKELITLFAELEIQRGSAAFICQNPSFDRAFFSLFVSVYQQEELLWPYHWLDLASMYWIERLNFLGTDFFKSVKLSKDSIADTYRLPPEAQPHKAMNGVQHLKLCYRSVVNELKNRIL